VPAAAASLSKASSSSAGSIFAAPLEVEGLACRSWGAGPGAGVAVAVGVGAGAGVDVAVARALRLSARNPGLGLSEPFKAGPRSARRRAGVCTGAAVPVHGSAEEGGRAAGGAAKRGSGVGADQAVRLQLGSDPSAQRGA
jgi:hypothetical protein